MRWRWLFLLALLTAPEALAKPGSAGPPVLVELFTSDGCPNCPPADELLKTLSAPGAVSGAHVIAMEWHIDAWNTAEWSDRFSLRDAIFRQRDYMAQIIHSTQMFTPQMVVGGTQTFVASEEPRARAAITKSAGEAQVPLTIARKSGDHLRVRATVKAPASVFVAVTEEGLTSVAPGGAHAGETIGHGPIVRWFKRVAGPLTGKIDVSVDVPVASEWNRSRLTQVVWLQDTQRILGVSSVPAR
jgi:hypothetical protein